MDPEQPEGMARALGEELETHVVAQGDLLRADARHSNVHMRQCSLRSTPRAAHHTPRSLEAVSAGKRAGTWRKVIEA